MAIVFFSACAVQLQGTSKLSREVCNRISTLGISLSECKHNLILKLRQLIVSEWINNSERYQPFLTETIVADEAPLFLQFDEFNHDLGNNAIGMANVFGMPIVMVSSLELYVLILKHPSRHSQSFVTLSCAEYECPEIEKYVSTCKVNSNAPPNYPIGRLCTEDLCLESLH